MLSVSTKNFSFEGLSLMGKKEKAVLDLVSPLDLGKLVEEDVDFEDDEEAPDGRLLSFEEKEIEFWFEDGTLTEIQWSPFWEDDDNRLWPEK